MAGGEASPLDGVRIVVTLAGADLDHARVAFGLTASTAFRQRVYFCEQPGIGRQLPLHDAGLVLALHALGNGDRKTVVALRPARPARLPASWAGVPRAAGVRVVGEWTPHDRIVTVAVHAVAPPAAAGWAMLTSLVPPAVFSPGQRRFLAECAPVRPSFGRLRALGPVEVLSWSREVQDLRLAADLWTVRPEALDLLELSVATEPPDAALVQPALLALLRRHGLDPEAVAQPSTRALLARLTGLVAAGRT